LGPRVDCCGNEALPLGYARDGLPGKVHEMDTRWPTPPAGVSLDQGRQGCEWGCAGGGKL